MREWILPAMVSFACWGLWGFTAKLATRYISPRSAMVYEVLGGLLVAAIVLYLLNFRLDVHPKGIFLALITGALGIIGALGFLYAVSKGRVSLVVSFTALYPVLGILLAVVILKEPITLKQGVGIILALIAMLLVAT